MAVLEPGLNYGGGREELINRFWQEFRLFIVLLENITIAHLAKKEHIWQNDALIEMQENISEARNQLINKKMGEWLEEHFRYGCRSNGVATELDLKFILAEMVHFRGVLYPPQIGEIPTTIEIRNLEIDLNDLPEEEVMTQAKNIKDSIEMFVKDIKRTRVGKFISGPVKKKKRKEKRKVFETCTRYLNEILKFSGAN